MSKAETTETIDYPESDGEPMGETDLHRDWMVRILDILRYRYRGKQVYIASDLLIYYEKGNPTRFVVPDDFVVLDCDPGLRRVFKTWEEKKVPNVVFEVTSKSSSHQDTVKKPLIYEAIGVQEYFVYDPTCDYLEPPLQGFRNRNGTFREIDAIDGVLQCTTLQLGLRLVEGELEMFDLETGVVALNEAEAEREAKEIERAGRVAAEQRNRELLLEIERLRKKLGEGQ